MLAGELRPDRGTASFSTVSVVLDRALSERISWNDLTEAASTAVRAVNEFLLQYRWMTGSFWAQPIKVTDGIEFAIWSRRNSGDRIGPRFHWKSPSQPGLVGFGSETRINDSNRVRLQDRLAAREPASMAHETILSAREHLHRGRTRNAVVDAATALEVLLADFIRLKLSAAGCTAAEIEDTFRDEGGQYLSVTALAKDVLRERLAVDFAGTAEYRDWNEKVLARRNAAVHGGPVPTPQEASAAIAAAERVARWLNQRV